MLICSWSDHFAVGSSISTRCEFCVHWIPECGKSVFLGLDVTPVPACFLGHQPGAGSCSLGMVSKTLYSHHRHLSLSNWGGGGTDFPHWAHQSLSPPSLPSGTLWGRKHKAEQSGSAHSYITLCLQGSQAEGCLCYTQQSSPKLLQLVGTSQQPNNMSYLIPLNYLLPKPALVWW